MSDHFILDLLNEPSMRLIMLLYIEDFTQVIISYEIY